MSQLPRTPRYFPKMKVRGARQRMRAQYQRFYCATDKFADSMRIVGTVALEVTANMDSFCAGMRKAVEITERAANKEGTQ